MLPDNVELLLGLEAGAVWEQTYEDAFIPGLLQTPGYVRAVINEAALHRWVGGREVMHAWLRHLLDAQHNATVRVLVLPYGAGEHPGQGQSFVLLTFPEPEDPAIVFLDYAHASGFLEKAPEVRQHTSVFGAVTSQAIAPDDSMRKIAEIAATFV